MPEDLSLTARLNLILRGRGGKEAEKQLGQVSRSAKKAKKDLGGVEKAVSGLGKTFTAALGGAALLGFVRSAVVGFAAYERSLKAIRIQLEGMGEDHTELIPKIDAFLQRLEAMSGVLRQDAAREFQRFLGITQDVQAAMVAVEISAGIANSGIRDMAGGATLLASILQGEVIEPAKSLAVAVRDVNGEVRSQEAILQDVIDTYLSLSGAQDDTRGSLDSMSAAWNRFKIAVGDLVSPILPALSALLGGIPKTIKSIPPALSIAFEAIAEFGRGTLNTFKIAMDPKNWFRPGEAVKVLMNERERTLSAIERASAFERNILRKIWEDHGTAEAQAEADAREAGRAKLFEIAKRANLKRQEAERRADEDAERKKAEQRLKIEEEAERRLLAQRIRMTEEGTDERLKLELEMLEMLEAQAIRSAKEIGAETLAIEETFRLARAELRRNFQAAQDEEEAEALKRRSEREFNAILGLIEARIEAEEEGSREREALEIARLEALRDEELRSIEAISVAAFLIRAKWAKKIEDFEKKSAEARARVERELARQKIAQALQIAALTVELAGVVFGESKALNYALAIINTARAITEALPDYTKAAIAAAIGAIQIATIARTEMGSGVSGGQSFGSISANTGVNSGSAAAAAFRPPPATTDDEGSTGGERGAGIVINGNVYGGRRGLRQLQRDLDEARPRSLRPATTTEAAR